MAIATGSFLNGYGPCDFAALEELCPPDVCPSLYTLYDLTAIGGGFGIAAVTVAGSDGSFRVTEVDYSLDGVPEPSSFVLLGTAAGLALLVCRSGRITHNLRLWLMRRARRRA